MSLRRLFRPLLGAWLFALAATSVVGCSAGASEEEDGPTTGSAAATVARPPQFVILAFDGSYNNAFWEESLKFARDNRLKFTYFISGVYFIPNASKSGYIAPHGLGAGKSAIGFGGTVDEINVGYGWLKRAHDEGNEIASHANGHFDGSRWTEADWNSEFDQFDKIIFQGIGVRPPALGFGPRDVVGFRAPQLGHSPGLFKTLPNKRYTYDTSKSTAANYWPEKKDGTWNFPLAQLRIVGSGKATLSMDYNFYIADSRGNPNPAGKETYKKQMIDTYMKYFEANYFGNRAPIHIGHHFSKWNGGAYWEAMQAFAKRVCGQAEVKCVTYKDLVRFMEENASSRADLQAGNFPKMARPPSLDDAKYVTEGISADEIGGTAEDHAAHDDNEHNEP
jgi:peptidoglycan/xylan/chitin deacetylase (PgdA/CDA1 family)